MTLNYDFRIPKGKCHEIINEFIDSGKPIAEIVADSSENVTYMALHKAIERHGLNCKVKTKRGHIYLVRNPDETST